MAIAKSKLMVTKCMTHLWSQLTYLADDVSAAGWQQANTGKAAGLQPPQCPSHLKNTRPPFWVDIQEYHRESDSSKHTCTFKHSSNNAPPAVTHWAIQLQAFSIMHPGKLYLPMQANLACTLGSLHCYPTIRPHSKQLKGQVAADNNC